MTASRQSSSHRFFLSLWYQNTLKNYLLSRLLLPLSWLFRIIVSIRRRQLSQQATSVAVPVVIVGNITVGGTGKTPVVIALAKTLVSKNIKVGVISRGYGGTHEHSGKKEGKNDENIGAAPLLVTPATPVEECGDESLLIAQETQCPIAISRDRVAAAQALIDQHPEIQIIISDDGLQHYRLQRSMEIVVIDGQRGVGNGLCLPAGPLREPVSRLQTVDWVVVNSSEKSALEKISQTLIDRVPSQKVTSITLKPERWLHLKTQQALPLEPFPWLKQANGNRAHNSADQGKTPITAVAGIGYPQRFFETLAFLGLSVETLAFDDHHVYTLKDFQTCQENIILMTVKDAVKCEQFAGEDWWALNVAAQLPNSLIDQVTDLIKNR